MLEAYLYLANHWPVLVFFITALLVITAYAVSIRLFLPQWLVKRKIRRLSYLPFDDPEIIRLREMETMAARRGLERFVTGVVAYLAVLAGVTACAMVRKSGYYDSLMEVFIDFMKGC